MLNIKQIIYIALQFCLIITFNFTTSYADEVNEFDVSLSNNQAGESSEYNLHFVLSSNAYSELKNGSLRLNFPPGFDLSNIDSVTISDNIPNIEYNINRIEVDQQKLILFFNQENNSNNQLDVTIKATVYINIFEITNPNIAGEYQLSAALIKRNGQLITGPELSDPFEIVLGTFIDFSFVEESFAPSTISTGADVSFNFEIINESNIELEFVPGSSLLELIGENYDGLTFVINSTDIIFPGPNSLYTGLITIPSELDTDILEAKISIAYRIPGYDDIRKFTFTFSPIHVTVAPVVQVNGLKIISPNSPFANTSQDILIKGYIVNRSEQHADNVVVELTSIEDYSTIHEKTKIVSVNPMDSTEVIFDVTAADIAPDLPEQFRLNITNENMIILPSYNNQTFLIINRPAELTLDYRLNGILNADNVNISPGDQFIFTVELSNLGEAKITPVNYRLIIDGLDVLPDTSVGTIDLDDPLDFIYNAPNINRTITFTFELFDNPIDINVNEVAPINRNGFQFSLNVQTVDAVLFVTPRSLGVNLIVPDEVTEISEITFENTDQHNNSDVQLEEFRVKLFDNDGNIIFPDGLVELSTTGFYFNGILVSTAYIDNEWIVFDFNNFIISSGDDIILIFALNYNESDLNFIRMRGSSTGLSGTFASGPLIGQPVRIDIFDNEPFLIDQKIVFVQVSMENSFIIEDNPFNPRDKEASFSFFVSEPAIIEFRIFTIIGEEVYFKSIPENEIIANSINYVEWDGRNSDGHLVRNGVYISYITNTRTGESARMKIALIK